MSNTNVVCVFAMQNVWSLTAKVMEQFNDAGHKINERIRIIVQSKKEGKVHLLVVEVEDRTFCMTNAQYVGLAHLPCRMYGPQQPQTNVKEQKSIVLDIRLSEFSFCCFRKETLISGAARIGEAMRKTKKMAM